MPLKITVDEDLPRQAVQLLREHGYEAASVIEQWKNKAFSGERGEEKK